ncbi:MAG: exostosin family protein [Terracidiphilus sp.]
MKVHLAAAKESPLTALMRLRAQHSSHTLIDDPPAADLILFLGNPTHEPHLLLDHPLYCQFPDKCAVYSEDDEYLPLLPSVYCSARSDESTRAGRVFTWSYVSASGSLANPHLAGSLANKSFLFSFQGGSTSILRKRLYKIPFNRPDVLIEDTSTYHHWELDQAGRDERQQLYARTIAASHFVLCPRGAGTSSIRLFEVMQAGIAPVLISDNYPLPPHVSWNTFLLRIAERDIKRLPELLEVHIDSSAERGRLARQAWLNHFAPEREFDAVVSLAATALRHGPPNEPVFRQRQNSMIVRANLRRKLRGKIRSAALKTLKILGVKSPYRMNR